MHRPNTRTKQELFAQSRTPCNLNLKRWNLPRVEQGQWEHAMLSVIIPTLNSERLLAPTLSTLIPGAISGLVREVTVADGGSTDLTLAIADGAGCTVVRSAASLGPRLREAAAAARSPWLMFLRAGTVLETSWLEEATVFMDEAAPPAACCAAAAFRRSASSRRPVIREALSRLRSGLARRVDPGQGLLIEAGLYKMVGGHRRSADPEADLLARLGHRRIRMLRSGARW